MSGKPEGLEAVVVDVREVKQPDKKESPIKALPREYQGEAIADMTGKRILELLAAGNITWSLLSKADIEKVLEPMEDIEIRRLLTAGNITWSQLSESAVEKVEIAGGPILEACLMGKRADAKEKDAKEIKADEKKEVERKKKEERIVYTNAKPARGLAAEADRVNVDLVEQALKRREIFWEELPYQWGAKVQAARFRAFDQLPEQQEKQRPSDEKFLTHALGEARLAALKKEVQNKRAGAKWPWDKTPVKTTPPTQQEIWPLLTPEERKATGMQEQREAKDLINEQALGDALGRVRAEEIRKKIQTGTFPFNEPHIWSFITPEEKRGLQTYRGYAQMPAWDEHAPTSSQELLPHSYFRYHAFPDVRKQEILQDMTRHISFTEGNIWPFLTKAEREAVQQARVEDGRPEWYGCEMFLVPEPDEEISYMLGQAGLNPDVIQDWQRGEKSHPVSQAYEEQRVYFKRVAPQIKEFLLEEIFRAAKRSVDEEADSQSPTDKKAIIKRAKQREQFSHRLEQEFFPGTKFSKSMLDSIAELILTYWIESTRRYDNYMWRVALRQELRIFGHKDIELQGISVAEEAFWRKLKKEGHRTNHETVMLGWEDLQPEYDLLGILAAHIGIKIPQMGECCDCSTSYPFTTFLGFQRCDALRQHFLVDHYLTWKEEQTTFEREIDPNKPFWQQQPISDTFALRGLGANPNPFYDFTYEDYAKAVEVYKKTMSAALIAGWRRAICWMLFGGALIASVFAMPRGGEWNGFAFLIASIGSLIVTSSFGAFGLRSSTLYCESRWSYKKLLEIQKDLEQLMYFRLSKFPEIAPRVTEVTQRASLPLLAASSRFFPPASPTPGASNTPAPPPTRRQPLPSLFVSPSPKEDKAKSPVTPQTPLLEDGSNSSGKKKKGKRKNKRGKHIGLGQNIKGPRFLQEVRLIDPSQITKQGGGDDSVAYVPMLRQQDEEYQELETADSPSSGLGRGYGATGSDES